MITALISLFSGLFSGVVPEILKEIKDSRAHKREIEFLALNQKLALERAAHEASVKIEETRSNQAIADIQSYEKQFDSLMRQAMTPIGIGWIDGFNAIIRPATALVFLVLFAIAIICFIFGIVNDSAFGATLGALFQEAMMGVIGFMFGNRAISSRIAKTA